MKKIVLFALLSLVGLIGCAENNNPRLETGACRVIITDHVPACCKKVDNMTATVINGVTVPYTSQCELGQRALHDLRIQAAREGANVIMITKNQVTYRVWPGFHKADSYTLSGTAYQCGGYGLERIQSLSLSQIPLTQICNKTPKCASTLF